LDYNQIRMEEAGEDKIPLWLIGECIVTR
jgi:hypothetical protein